VKVFGRIALVGVFNRTQLANRAINSLVGQVLGRGATSAVKESYQTSANVFVLAASLLAVSVQPIEKVFKRLWGQFPILYGFGHKHRKMFGLIQVNKGGQTA
jgi:hypothetical protein